jgi:hypothetical protein
MWVCVVPSKRGRCGRSEPWFRLRRGPNLSVAPDRATDWFDVAASAPVQALEQLRERHNEIESQVAARAAASRSLADSLPSSRPHLGNDGDPPRSRWLGINRSWKALRRWVCH